MAEPSKPLRLSWSRIRDHEECKQRGFLKSTGHRSPVADVRNYFGGNVVDRCMRNWLESDDPRPGGMAEMVHQQMEDSEKEAVDAKEGVIRWRNASDRSTLETWCVELVNRLEPILYKYAVPFDYQPARRFEVPITIPHPEGYPERMFLIGEMDLLIRDNDKRWFIYDLKGTNNESYWRKVVGQLLFYEIAVKLEYGEWPAASGLIQPMCKEQVLPFVFSEENRRDMFYRITKAATDIWRRDSSPKADNAGCNRCEVQHACVKFAARPGSNRQVSSSSIINPRRD